MAAKAPTGSSQPVARTRSAPVRRSEPSTSSRYRRAGWWSQLPATGRQGTRAVGPNQPPRPGRTRHLKANLRQPERRRFRSSRAVVLDRDVQGGDSGTTSGAADHFHWSRAGVGRVPAFCETENASSLSPALAASVKRVWLSEIASDAAEFGFEKIHFVELASVTDPRIVDNAVLEAIGGGSHRAPLQATLNHLREDRALVVLDSGEHVLQALGHVVEVLLNGCPLVAILATSRSPLDIVGELVWSVPALSMRGPDDSAEAGPSDVGRLFVDRASHVKTCFELGDGVLEAVETICSSSRRHSSRKRIGGGASSGLSA